MAYEQKDNSGAIFKNDKKEKDTQPDYKGKCVIDGVEKQISLWVKKSKSGMTYMSAAFQDPYNGGGSKGSSAQANDDIPF